MHVKFTACWILSIQFLCCTVALSNDSFDAMLHPDPEIGEYYRSNEKDILRLTRQVKDSSLGEERRIGAFEQLHKSYSDPAIALAASLVTDDVEAVASKASRILANAGVMMSHKMPSDVDRSTLPSAIRHLMKRNHLVLKALREAVADPRKGVREPAARVLAGQSDEIGLRNIADAKNKGVYSDQEHVRLLSLGSPESCAPYLAPYMRNDDEDVRRTAIECLGTLPQYQGQIRDSYLFNDAAPMALRIAAAESLPNVDFLPLIASADTPGPLHAAAMKNYLRTEGRELPDAQLLNVLRMVKNFPYESDAVRDSVIDRINALRKTKQGNTGNVPESLAKYVAQAPIEPLDNQIVGEAISYAAILLHVDSQQYSLSVDFADGNRAFARTVKAETVQLVQHAFANRDSIGILAYYRSEDNTIDFLMSFSRNTDDEVTKKK